MLLIQAKDLYHYEQNFLLISLGTGDLKVSRTYLEDAGAMLCTKVTSAPRCLGERANPIPNFPVEALPIKRTGSKQTISSAVRLGLDAADACELLAYYRIFRGE